MGELVAIYVLPALAVVTYLLQVWTGIAVCGFSGDNMLVDRRTKPGPYWFIIAIQTLLLVGIPIVVWIGR